MWFIGVEVEQETSAPPPKKNPGSSPVTLFEFNVSTILVLIAILFLSSILNFFLVINYFMFSSACFN